NTLHKCGDIRSIVLKYSKYSSRYTKVLDGEEPNIFSLNFSGGALVDLGVYPLSAATSLFGTPIDTAYYPTKISKCVDESVTLILTYNNFIFNIISSKFFTTTNYFTIICEKIYYL